MGQKLIPIRNTDGSIADMQSLSRAEQAGLSANKHAAQNVFIEYMSRMAKNTLRVQRVALAKYAEFLEAVGLDPGDLQFDPQAWKGITWGMVEAFKKWLVGDGYAIATINLMLSSIRTYTGLAAKAGVISVEESILISHVKGYSDQEAIHIDDQREKTRVGVKKESPVRLTPRQAKRLKLHPDVPQGRRDAVLMCLLLDHGLRCSEVAGLKVGDFDLEAGQMTFYRPKTNDTTTHNLSDDTLRAVWDYAEYGDMPIGSNEFLLRSSRKNKSGEILTGPGMSARGISKRVQRLGWELLGIDNLSPHDCRHYWATYWAKHINELPRGVFTLKEAGGWKSLSMVDTYIEASKIANEGMS